MLYVPTPFKASIFFSVLYCFSFSTKEYNGQQNAPGDCYNYIILIYLLEIPMVSTLPTQCI